MRKSISLIRFKETSLVSDRQPKEESLEFRILEMSIFARQTQIKSPLSYVRHKTVYIILKFFKEWADYR
jgi:hypothetical protein